MPPRQRTKRPAEAIIGISDTRLNKKKAKRSSEQSAFAAFNRCLVVMQDQFEADDYPDCYDPKTFPQHLLTATLISYFGNYLAKSGHSWETASGYMSRVWTKIQEDFPSVPLTTGNLSWYTRVRKVTQDLVSELNAAHGIQSGSTPSLNEGDLEVISTVLYRHEQYDGRLKVILSKQCGGRITEICKLRSTDFDFQEAYKSVVVHLERTKTHDEQFLNLVPHSTHFLKCPLHALASVAIMMERSGDDIFNRSATEDSFTDEIELVLNTLGGTTLESGQANPAVVLVNGSTHVLTTGLISRSGRVGMATDLCDNPDVRTRFVGDRGNWQLGGIATLFTYKKRTPTGDMVCARALSEWPNVQGGGVLPDSGCVPSSDSELFRTWLNNVFQPKNWSSRMKSVLGAALLMRRNQMLLFWKDDPVLMRMEKAAIIACGPEYGKYLKKWSDQFAQQFITLNQLYCDLSLLADHATIPVASIKTDLAHIGNEQARFNLMLSREIIKRDNQISSLTSMLIAGNQRTELLLEKIDALNEKLDATMSARAARSVDVTPSVTPGARTAPVSTPLPTQKLLFARTSRPHKLEKFPYVQLDGVDIGTAFIKWHCDGLKDIVLPTGDKRTRDTFNILKRLFAHLERFIPESRLLTYNEPAQTVAIGVYHQWREDIVKDINDALSKAIAACTAYKQHLSNENGNTKQVIAIKKKVHALYAFLCGDKHKAPLPDDYYP